jgi:hypothetical protein
LGFGRFAVHEHSGICAIQTVVYGGEKQLHWGEIENTEPTNFDKASAAQQTTNSFLNSHRCCAEICDSKCFLNNCQK